MLPPIAALSSLQPVVACSQPHPPPTTYGPIAIIEIRRGSARIGPGGDSAAIAYSESDAQSRGTSKSCWICGLSNAGRGQKKASDTQFIRSRLLRGAWGAIDGSVETRSRSDCLTSHRKGNEQ